MAKLTRTSVFKAQGSNAEPQIDKTTRAVQKIVKEEAEQRNAKINRLRNARLERDANTPIKSTR